MRYSSDYVTQPNINSIEIIHAPKEGVNSVREAEVVIRWLKVDSTDFNSKTKMAKTMKLCTVMVHHISTKTEQLNFKNFHCTLVCLIIKSRSKMVESSNTPYKNEIDRVPNSFSKDSKIYIFFAKGT